MAARRGMSSGAVASMAGFMAGGLIALLGYELTNARSPIITSVVMPLVRLLDAEDSHRLAIRLAKWGLAPRDRKPDDPILATTVFGRSFTNPLGLAAGFDKQAEVMGGMLRMGFGFVEIGSVTPQPQPGNPRPRMFRLTEDKAVINRYGFNSDGLAVVEQRLARWKSRENSRPAGIVGVNLGKNKTQTDAKADYAAGMASLSPYADYVVINVSSPNTPGLRALQGREELDALVAHVQAAQTTPVPLLLKIAPDLNDEDKRDIADVAISRKLSGLIVTNTTIERPSTLKSEHKSETGGLSGAPLREMSTKTVEDMYRLTQGAIPIIGVGGISSGADAYDKIIHGASLVQLYSALAYEGPALVPAVKDELAALLRKNGFSSVSEAVGSAVTAVSKKKH